MISQFYQFLGLFFNLLVPVHRNYCQSSTFEEGCLIPQPDYTIIRLRPVVKKTACVFALIIFVCLLWEIMMESS